MKKVMWFIAALFIGGIFFWYGMGDPQPGTLASIGNAEITVREFQRRLTQQVRREREQRDEELTEIELIEIRRNLLSSLISQELRNQEAANLGISIEDEEIIATIQSLPQFHQDGTFNFRLYEQALRFSMNMTTEEFEELIRTDLSIRKLERLILSSTKVTQSELKLHHLDEHGSLEGFEENMHELRSEVLQNKRIALYENWMRYLQEKFEITVNQQLAGL